MWGWDPETIEAEHRDEDSDLFEGECVVNIDYERMIKQAEALIETDRYYVPVLANISALLWETLDRINWAGFYIVRNGELVLGPFQGKVACIHIKKGRGVCGTAWEKDEPVLVPDVHQFPGHIACDSASRSEIVIPIHCGGGVAAVLDIDSPEEGRFLPEDLEGLCGLTKLLENSIEW